MPTTALPIKRQNHRVHPCDPQRKPELLNLLIARYPGERILVVTSHDPETIAGTVTADNVTVASDAALAHDTKAEYDLLISYDLPESAVAYMTRLAQVRTYALILLDPAEQNRLYPIETFLGRTILQEVVEGFESAAAAAPERRRTPSKNGDAKRDSKPRRDGGKPDRSRDENRKSGPKAPHKNKKGAPRYLGKDENGKPLFSAKTGERNHRYDGTPKSDEEKAAGKKKQGKPKFSGAQKGGSARDRKPGGPAKPRKETGARRDDAAKSAPKRPPRRIPLKKSPKEGGQ